MAVARTTVGKIFPSTMAPSNKGPKNGTCGKWDDMIYEHLMTCEEQNVSSSKQEQNTHFNQY